MKRALPVVLSAIFSLVAITLPVFAHHGFQAEYDGTKLVYVTGVLTKLEWENPHIYVYVDAKGADGKITTWQLEGDSPNVVKRAGTQRQDILASVGKTVTVRACPSKDGAARGAAETVKLADGREMAVGGRRYNGNEKPGDGL